jgi:Tol biopolymer transport system component/regulation of enolase protein 1 (concanavalin A-like superfamily)
MSTIYQSIFFGLLLAPAFAQGENLGIFTNSGDVGAPVIKGSVQFSDGQYRVTGSGANIWGKQDQFQYVWREMSGDFTVTAAMRFLGKGAEHRKAGIMVRQSLDSDATYGDVVIHGNGMPGLQWRSRKGEDTNAFDFPNDGQGTFKLKLIRTGVKIFMYLGKDDAEPKEIAHTEVTFQHPVLVGLVVCSHDANVSDTVVFSDVSVEAQGTSTTAAASLTKRVAIRRSNISVYDLADKSVKVLYSADQMIEAPTYSPNGKDLLVNSKGDLWTLPADGSSRELTKLDLGSIGKCNNDKGFSPNGKLIAFSSSATGKGSQVYTVPSAGGTPKMVVSETPSYFHAFSPDGKWLAVVAQRNNNFDLFRLPVEGGEQERLTADAGYDDGPDYSPDGKWIYFNSNRSGKWEIWRMPAKGAGPGDKKAQQVTKSAEVEAWFPHCSPDGKWLVFIAFPKGTAGHNDHLNVKLGMIPLPGTRIKSEPTQTLLEFFGGQGTINVNSWSPDSKKFAFVSYEQ